MGAIDSPSDGSATQTSDDGVNVNGHSEQSALIIPGLGPVRGGTVVTIAGHVREPHTSALLRPSLTSAVVATVLSELCPWRLARVPLRRV